MRPVVKAHQRTIAESFVLLQVGNPAGIGPKADPAGSLGGKAKPGGDDKREGETVGDDYLGAAVAGGDLSYGAGDPDNECLRVSPPSTPSK